MDDDYFVDAREGMKWDVSPFKAKEIPAFVATPSNKWSNIDNDDSSMFRSRLHSSPYLDNEKIKQLRPELSGCVEATSSPHCGRRLQKIASYSSSSRLSSKLTDDSDSGIHLHQTQFYDTFSSAAHSTDSGIQLSVLHPGSAEARQVTAVSSASVSSGEYGRPNAKYSFDPLAPPFKPKGTNVTEIKVPLQRGDVMAIDVAKSISTAYQNELHRKKVLGVLGDITNLTPLANAPLITNGRQTVSGFQPASKFPHENEPPPLWGQRHKTLDDKSRLFDNYDTFNGEREKVISADKMTDRNHLLSDPYPLANGFRRPPATKQWISNATPPSDFSQLEKNVDKRRYELFNGDKIGLGSLKAPFDNETEGSGVTIGMDLKDNDSAGESLNGLNPQDRKVTFADIVRAGMKAINRRQAEDRLDGKICEGVPSGLFGEFCLSTEVQMKNQVLDFPKLPGGTDERSSYRPSKYRTEPCTTFHTIGVCPYGSRCNFYHEPNEKKEAPTVSKAMRYKTRLCKTWQKAGECPYGVKCDFAHGTNDLASNSPYRPHYKTRMCKVLQQTGRCPYGAQCTFAHKQGELRTDISLIYKYKTEICKSWALGLECSHGNDCHFAHGEKELNKDSCPDEHF